MSDQRSITLSSVSEITFLHPREGWGDRDRQTDMCASMYVARCVCGGFTM